MNSQLLWFTARGAGIVSLILLSAIVVLGILSQRRASASWWPRFLTPALHRNLSLMAVVFLLIHIVTAVVDPFTHLGLVAATIPFSSYYRTVWLGLGTISFELLLAIIASSLLRARFGARAWKAIHLLSYPLWVTAVIHGLGTGSDTLAPWMESITALCVLAVVTATAVRVARPPVFPLATEKRSAAHAFRGGAR